MCTRTCPPLSEEEGFVFCLVFSFFPFVIVWLAAGTHTGCRQSGCINLCGKLTESKCFPIRSYERGLSVLLTEVCWKPPPTHPPTVTYSDCNEIPIKSRTTQSIYSLRFYNFRRVTLWNCYSSLSFDKVASFLPHIAWPHVNTALLIKT